MILSKLQGSQQIKVQTTEIKTGYSYLQLQEQEGSRFCTDQTASVITPHLLCHQDPQSQVKGKLTVSIYIIWLFQKRATDFRNYFKSEL